VGNTPLERTVLAVGIVLACLLCYSSAAHADRIDGLNLSGGAWLSAEAPSVGIAYEIAMSPTLGLVPNIDYVFTNPGHEIRYNVDARYRWTQTATNPMWFGAGVGLVDRDLGGNPLQDDRDVALNLLWGMDFRSHQGSFTPFVSTRIAIADNSDFGVTFGIHFGSAARGPETRHNEQLGELPQQTPKQYKRSKRREQR